MSNRSVFIVLPWLVSLAALYGISRFGHASEANVQIPESRIYKLKEVAALLRSEGRTQLFVNLRDGERQLFVSQGYYVAGELTEAVRVASGLRVRSIGNTRFLTSEPFQRVELSKPMLPRDAARRIGQMLEPVEYGATYAGYSKSAFIERKIIQWSDLSPNIQSKVKSAVGNTTLHQPHEWKLRLGTSYLLAFVALGPSNDERFTHTEQIYYDYRDELQPGELPPDD